MGVWGVVIFCLILMQCSWRSSFMGSMCVLCLVHLVAILSGVFLCYL